MRRRRPAPEPSRDDVRPPAPDQDIERLPPRHYHDEPRARFEGFEGFDGYRSGYSSGYAARDDYRAHQDYGDGGYDDYDADFGAYDEYAYDEYDERADGRANDDEYADDARAADVPPSRGRRPEREGRTERSDAKPGRDRRSAPSRPQRGRSKRARTRRRFFGWIAALGVIAGLAASIWFGSQKLLGFDYDDYEGAGVSDVVIKVSKGDSTSAIATTLVEADVVASRQAFLTAAQGNTEIRSIQPGYYKMRAKASGANALNSLLEDKARVGHLQLKSGTQLHDVKLSDGSQSLGVFSKLSKASCTKLDGESTCVSADQLAKVAAKTDLVALGVPKWLARDAADAPADRRLEGLVAPGLYDVKPGWSAQELLTEVLTTSSARYEAAGLPDAARNTGYSPYEIVVIASVVEREGVTADFGKISRVIYNRMNKGMRLEMDSTINYVLDQPNLRTSSNDRAKKGPYNTYRNTGLPPTPISSPSTEALEAAVEPPKGKWLYFVRCEENGLSCFAKTYDKHRANVADAQRRGVW
ncbi:endolytic transglycosylase MltG [Haloechinothrix salitolerans]|uniref:Endolytic murein transglycosylase n=1 Tax=Haloechinothrix salitolerans TaxID=926830 RepID=A0ABW2C203_9PSEU